MKNKLKVAVFNTQPPHLYFGGIERRIIENAKNLVNDVDTTVYCGTKKGFNKTISINKTTFVPCFCTDVIWLQCATTDKSRAACVCLPRSTGRLPVVSDRFGNSIRPLPHGNWPVAPISTRCETVVRKTLDIWPVRADIRPVRPGLVVPFPPRGLRDWRRPG